MDLALNNLQRLICHKTQQTKQTKPGLFKNVIYKMCFEIIYSIYMNKIDLVLNNQQWLKCHKAKPSQNQLVTIVVFFPLEEFKDKYLLSCQTLFC